MKHLAGHNAMLHHIVLPRVLPQEKSSDLQATELHLMRYMVENVENMDEWIPRQTVNLFRKLKKVQTDCTPQKVSAAIRGLEPGDTFAMFVQNQQCAIMIHVPPNENIVNIKRVIVASIPGSLPPSEVYGHTSDIEFNYPERAIKVQFSPMLQSQVFARQLCTLNEFVPTERKEQDWITKWLMTLVMDEKCTVASEEEFSVITKKIRDEILGEDEFNYFRRSSFYLCMKALLQHSLTMHLGAGAGKTLYKIVMLKFLTDICASYKGYDEFDIDLLSQMIAKLARRIEKLSSMIIDDDFANLYIDVCAESKETIKAIREKIDSQIECIHQRDERRVELPPMNELDFTADIVSKMPKLKTYMDERHKNTQETNAEAKLELSSYERYFKAGLPNVNCIDKVKDEMGKRVFWLEFEWVILYDMKMGDDRWSEDDLRTWSFAYAKYAEDKYRGNQLFISQMLLVRLKMVAMLDERATKKHPLLKDFRSGINQNIIDCLLLPQRIDMGIAYQIEEYFRNRNDLIAGPSLIEEKILSQRSFSVKYATGNSTMRKVLADILEKDEKNVNLKKTEWKENRDKFEKLRNEYSRLECQNYTNFRNKRTHGNDCRRCYLKRQASMVRIKKYEHLLPEDEIKQLGIVFELNIPPAIACLRDVLYTFVAYCHGDSEKLSTKTSWNERLSEFNSSTSKCITLGSKSKRDRSDLVVDCEFDKFIIENLLDCTFSCKYRTMPPTLKDNPIKKACTFNAQDEYAGLQWAINNTKYTENHVMASLSNCPPELTLSEYKKFGTLRADGHRLQIRKLYERIETGTLASEKESVLSLVMQTLWECGISGEDNEIRESHIDFNDAKFCPTMIQLLCKFAEQHRSNWKHPFKLLTATLVAIRAFEINEREELANQIAELLGQIRSIALDWLVKIENAIRDMRIPNENTERDLRLKLIYVAIIGGMTYFIHPRHKFYGKIFANNMDGNESVTAVRSWLRFIISLRNNVRLYTNNDQNLPSNLRMFLRLMESIGISLQQKVTDLKEDNEIFGLIRKQWSRAEYATFKKIKFDQIFPHILCVVAQVDSALQTVTIDIINGSFLVDGLPLSRLPDKIIQAEVYQWFFGNVVFEVQPDAHGTFSTVQKYNGCTYEFKMNGEDVIITERKVNAFEKELIDHNTFSEDFPHYLANNYSHWWNKNDNCIEFRKRTFGKTHFSKETNVEYRLDLSNRRLIHVRTQRPMLDIQSGSYRLITKQVQRLEHSKYIHVLLMNDQVASVELLRMNLKFTIDCSSESRALMSNEFNGMRVSRKQKIGTLCGLEHGLVLESIVDGRQIMLVPNGELQIEVQDNLAAVRIETEKELQSPPFYQYQVDQFCRQLKSRNGTHESWFYLAYLHAITSHGEVEPFTGMSGTERALQILQSAFAWSSTPYSAEAVEILKQIAELTPLREFKEGKQVITWPTKVPKRAAQECFVFVAQKLLADSQRLHKLHGESPEKKIDLKTKLDLNERDHRRCQQLNPNLRVSNVFIEPKLLNTSPPFREADSFSENTKTVSILANKRRFQVPKKCNLKELLTTKETLIGLGHIERLKDVVNHSFYDEFRNVWLSLYIAAVEETLSLDEFQVILSCYAHRGEDIAPILALQAIATNPRAFSRINPPPSNVFKPSAGIYKCKDVANLLKKYYKQPDEYSNKVWSESIRQNHDTTRKTIMDDISATIKNNWPCESVNFVNRWPTFQYIDFKKANEEVNKQLKIWHDNHLLHKFIKDVEKQLQTLSALSVGPIIHHLLFETPAPKRWSKTSIDFEAKVRDISKRYAEQIEEAKGVWEMSAMKSYRSAQNWWDVYSNLCDSDETQHLIQAGIFPRLVPSLLVPRIMDQNYDYGLKCLIGAYAMAIAREQRDGRIEAYRQRPEHRAALDREEEPHRNWKPCEYPEWLLFEIEQNLTIRHIQIEIAKRMIDNPNDQKHSVMQLNMGEGKTAVIVPIVAAKLADGKQACQIMVLKSLFATNLKSLRQYLGGFLDRRIYIFPCRRNLPIESHVHEILEIYEECKGQKGVILTIPEHRLSFQLKIYETISLQLKIEENRNYDTANDLLKVHKWTNANVRTVLDESDAILHAKYQLVYTAGNQLQPDGGSQRWLIVQALLKRIPEHMRRLYTEFGPEKIEFGHTFAGDKLNRTDVFTPCRILDESVFEALKEALINDFLDGRFDIDFPGLDDTRRQHLAHLLGERVVEQSKFRTIEQFSEEDQNIVLILSGFLRFEILKLALTKRWRVNYGVDAKGKRRMAIPFKAKDVAAENTEFGHPDVAVCFTQMSYYYSGLTDAQLYQIFNILENKPDAPNIYAKWIESIPEELVSLSIVSYSGVNLDDPDQRDNVLFPLLRFNMNAIDFWLSNVVFEQELKVFEKKLMCTAWDLCSESFKHRVTGFSGTNDTKNTLPMPIEQNDLVELENTNAQMRETLLQSRNKVYQNPADVSGRQILQELVALEIPVLLDSGALMLELSNKEVAIEWLKLDETSKYDAAVYFDGNDTLQTIDRNGIVTEFQNSVYREDLSKCVVYLDDEHTRGTDLKFPPNCRACVTLSGDITRDKTVQSCMRMRQLASTQSILFWPSYEAGIHLRKLSGQLEVESRHVMKFIEKNSAQLEMANMVHWTTAALNYTKKLIGHKLHEDSIEENALQMLYNACVDTDFVKLKTMYGEKEEGLLSRIAWKIFGELAYSYKSKIRQLVEQTKINVVDKLEDLAPDVKRFTHALDEEQEKELEQEVEEQIQVERPPEAQPAEPKIDRRMKQLVLGGVVGGIVGNMKSQGALLSIAASLSKTQMFDLCIEAAWAENIFVTKDFHTVISSQSQISNDFLRPVCWIARINHPTAKDIVVLLSSFECNHLLPAFRESENSTLFMYHPRLSSLQSNLIHETGLQVTGMRETNPIDLNDEVQIGVYAGSMYFRDENEQNAFCGFLGLVPRPWTNEQQMAFEDGYIEEDGFVPFRKRIHQALSQSVSQCVFKNNPKDLAVKLIKAHHQLLPKDSHVASILNRGRKALGVQEDMQVDEE